MLRKVTELTIVEHVNDTDYLVLDQNGNVSHIMVADNFTGLRGTQPRVY